VPIIPTAPHLNPATPHHWSNGENLMGPSKRVAVLNILVVAVLLTYNTYDYSIKKRIHNPKAIVNRLEANLHAPEKLEQDLVYLHRMALEFEEYKISSGKGILSSLLFSIYLVFSALILARKSVGSVQNTDQDNFKDVVHESSK
jgi:hypothetical protein